MLYLLSVAFLLHIPMSLWCHAMILLPPNAATLRLPWTQSNLFFAVIIVVVAHFFLSCKLPQLLRF